MIYCIRIKDNGKQWCIDKNIIHIVVREKLDSIRMVRSSWSTFASIDEDENICKAHWNEMIWCHHIIMILYWVIYQSWRDRIGSRQFSKHDGGDCGKDDIFT